MFVEDYMSASPMTVREAAPLRDAAQFMQQHRIRHLPVLDESGRLVGIITDRDIRQNLGLGEPLRENLTVADVMTADPVTIPVSATLDEAVRLLTEHRFGALPVVNGKTLVGIITYLDALRALAQVFGLNQLGCRIESVMSEGALTARQKELIALGIGLAVRREPCINLHVEKCIEADATGEQILEAAGVAVMVQGEAVKHVPEVIRALEHLESTKAPQARYGLAARFRLPTTNQGAARPNGKARR